MDLRLGAWQEVLADVECDMLCVDPPYGSRTHAGHDAGVNASGKVSERAKRDMEPAVWATARRNPLAYGYWTPDDVRDFVLHWEPRTKGWFCAMSCSDLAHHWRQNLEWSGRVTFAPVACVIRAMSVRLAGDGPASWVVYLNVARPRGGEPWGALNGAYVTGRGSGQHIGGKPLDLMRAIVRDYSRAGDLVCDPCAGLATTGIAALGLGRRFVGAEIDPDTHARAMQRVGGGCQMDMFA